MLPQLEPDIDLPPYIENLHSGPFVWIAKQGHYSVKIEIEKYHKSQKVKKNQKKTQKSRQQSFFHVFQKNVEINQNHLPKRT